MRCPYCGHIFHKIISKGDFVTLAECVFCGKQYTYKTPKWRIRNEKTSDVSNSNNNL